MMRARAGRNRQLQRVTARLRRRANARAAALAVAVALAGACSQHRPATDRGITVLAAASLTEAFTDLGRLFEQQHPAIAARLSFAGSQQLATQIVQGAEADVFASADARWMRLIEERGLTAGPPVSFAWNRLVVITPLADPGHVRRLDDLARPGVRLVVAAVAVPVGAYTREVLRRLSQSPDRGPAYGPAVLRNVVSQEENVKSVVAKVQLGEADAGFVYRSDVTLAVSRHVRLLEIPERDNVSAEYPIAVLRRTQNPAAAQAFVALVRSPEGQRVMERYGFAVVQATASAEGS